MRIQFAHTHADTRNATHIPAQITKCIVTYSAKPIVACTTTCIAICTASSASGSPSLSFPRPQLDVGLLLCQLQLKLCLPSPCASPLAAGSSAAPDGVLLTLQGLELRYGLG